MQLLKTLRLTAVATVLLAALGAPAALASPSVYVTASPNPVKAGATVTYTVAADAVNGTSTATVRDDGDPIAGCVDLPVVDEAATCTVAAPATPGWHDITVGLTTGVHTNYSNWYPLTVQAPTTTTVTAAPKLADPGQAMKYVATVSPRPLVQITSIDDPGPRAAATAAASLRRSTSPSTAAAVGLPGAPGRRRDRHRELQDRHGSRSRRRHVVTASSARRRP